MRPTRHNREKESLDDDDDPEVVKFLKRNLPERRPVNIFDLWQDESSSIDHTFQHYLSEHIHLWASREEILHLIQDKKQLRAINSTICKNSIHFGMLAELEEPSVPLHRVYLAVCQGCNQPCDIGEMSGGGVKTFVKEPCLNVILHTLLIIMTTVCQLLAYPEADDLILMMNAPYDMENTSAGKFDTGLTAGLLGIFDNCSHYPKLVQVNAALFSLICARAPTITLGGLDEDMFVPAILKYLHSTFPLVHNTNCMVDEYFGVVAFINVLPLLFHFGSWGRSHRHPAFKEMVSQICMFLIDICNSATLDIHECKKKSSQCMAQNACGALDSRPSLKEFPETIGARIYIERMIANEDDEDSTQGKWRTGLLRDHPKTFATFAALEVLQWYSLNGIDLANSWPPMWRLNVVGLIDRFSEEIRYLIRHHAELQYMDPILTAMIEGRKMPKPTEARSLLFGPLHNARRRCGLPSCRKREVFLRCSGCNKMEFYCCKEHQKEHWKDHKLICKKLRTKQPQDAGKDGLPKKGRKHSGKYV